MTAAAPGKLNPLAQALNETLSQNAPEILEMLSRLGRALYFPKGILSQTADAAEGIQAQMARRAPKFGGH